ncbi:MAG: hypothetical protein MUF06_22690 [Pirellulaceae bacterium]|jgi:hypothetical protein|nr:hypothetical protein [Pirellulaceae bacterium]
MPRSSSSPASRFTRSALAGAIVAALLLATFTPVQWLRGRLPRWSSPSRSLQAWSEPPDSTTSREIWWLYRTGNTSAPVTISNFEHLQLLMETARDETTDSRWEEQPPSE